VATIGTLIVEMRANTAQFNTSMDGAHEKLGKTTGISKNAEQALSKFAAKGIGEIIPIGNRAENALDKLFSKMLHGKGVLGQLGTATVVLGAAFAAFKLGNLIGEWLALGTSVENYKKQIEEAKKAQDELIASLRKQHDVTSGLDKQLATLADNWQEVIRLEKEARDASIRDNFGPNEKRSALLAKSEQIATEQIKAELEKRRKEQEKSDDEFLKNLLKQREETFKVWQQQTEDFAKQLQARAKARADFESQFGQGGLAGNSASKGIREALDLQKDLQKELRDLAFSKREGFLSETDVVAEMQNIRDRAIAAGQDIKDKFGGAFPAVDDAVAKVLTRVDSLGSEFEQARAFIGATVPTVAELTNGLQQFGGMLQAMPAATESARGAIASLSQQYFELAQSIAVARQEAEVFAQTMQ
jgi:hypothetical protein